MGLALFDAYKFITFSWLSIVEYLLRILEIFVYTTIGAQTIQFWNLYEEDNDIRRRRRRRQAEELYGKNDMLMDVSTAGAIALLIAVVIAGFGAAIGISEEKTWHIMSW